MRNVCGMGEGGGRLRADRGRWREREIWRGRERERGRESSFQFTGSERAASSGSYRDFNRGGGSLWRQSSHLWCVFLDSGQDKEKDQPPVTNPTLFCCPPGTLRGGCRHSWLGNDCAESLRLSRPLTSSADRQEGRIDRQASDNRGRSSLSSFETC